MSCHYSVKIIFFGYSKSPPLEIMDNGWRPAECQMSMGCPVIASTASSIPEVVDDAAILFDPYSKDGLIDAIESLYGESTRNDLIKRGFELEKSSAGTKWQTKHLIYIRAFCN